MGFHFREISHLPPACSTLPHKSEPLKLRIVETLELSKLISNEFSEEKESLFMKNNGIENVHAVLRAYFYLIGFI